MICVVASHLCSKASLSYLYLANFFNVLFFGTLEDKLVSKSIVFVVEEIEFIIHQLRILHFDNEIGTFQHSTVDTKIHD